MSSAALDLVETAIAGPLADVASSIDDLLDEVLAVPEDPSAPLFEAMRYAAIGAGKRLRPLLVCASADLFDVPRAQSLRAALAVECIHVHSLIHDDLPCMDDDALRRGKPTVHIAFDEATAVLAGDSLLALAFEILGNARTHSDPDRRCELVRSLARAAGASGMAGGQMLDLGNSNDADMDSVTRLQRFKTGSLIGWAVEAGAILGDATSEAITSLRAYARNVGLAFQIADDLLDVRGDQKLLGKRLRKDESQGKHTFVSLLGEERAESHASIIVEQAVGHLRIFEGRASLLAAIAQFAILRSR